MCAATMAKSSLFRLPFQFVIWKLDCSYIEHIGLKQANKKAFKQSQETKLQLAIPPRKYLAHATGTWEIYTSRGQAGKFGSAAKLTEITNPENQGDWSQKGMANSCIASLFLETTTVKNVLYLIQKGSFPSNKFNGSQVKIYCVYI